MEPKILKTVVVFVAMAVVYVVLVIIGSKQVEPFNQLILVGTGCAIFGGGLAFFLLRMFQLEVK
jgi:hypothetical protein